MVVWRGSTIENHVQSECIQYFFNIFLPYPSISGPSALWLNKKESLHVVDDVNISHREMNVSHNISCRGLWSLCAIFDNAEQVRIFSQYRNGLVIFYTKKIHMDF